MSPSGPFSYAPWVGSNPTTGFPIGRIPRGYAPARPVAGFRPLLPALSPYCGLHNAPLLLIDTLLPLIPKHPMIIPKAGKRS